MASPADPKVVDLIVSDARIHDLSSRLPYLLQTRAQEQAILSGDVMVGDGQNALVDSLNHSLDLMIFLKKAIEEDASFERLPLLICYERSLHMAATLAELAATN